MAKPEYTETFNMLKFIADACGIPEDLREKVRGSMPEDVRGELEALDNGAAIDFLSLAFKSATEEVAALTAQNEQLMRLLADAKVKSYGRKRFIDDLELMLTIILMRVVEQSGNELNFWIKTERPGMNITTMSEEMRRALDGDARAVRSVAEMLAVMLREGPKPTFQCGHSPEECSDECRKKLGPREVVQ